jgi:dipeptidyl aminopeptidase/acylaminoacyl peptidase
MRPFGSKILALAIVASLAISPALAQNKVLTHAEYDSWKSLIGPRLSNDGKFLTFTISPQDGDGMFEVKSTDGSKSYKFDRGTNIRFTEDSRYLIATITPTKAELKEATDKKVPAADRPKNGLLILNLQTGQETKVPNITSYSIASKGSEWILIKPEPPKKEEEKKANPAQPLTDQEKAQEKSAEKAEEKKASGHSNGTDYTLHNLRTGEQIELHNVGISDFNEKGTKFYYNSTPEKLEGHGIFVVDLATKKTSPIMEGLAQYGRMVFNEKQDQIAIICDIDDYRSKNPSQSIFTVSADGKNLKRVAFEGDAGIPKGWYIPKSSSVRWNSTSDRIQFSTVEKPPAEEPKKDDTPASERADLDVWSWTDKQLQPQQALSAAREKNRTYTAILDLKDKKIYQVETKEIPDVSLPRDFNGDYGIISEEQFTGAGATPSDVFKYDFKKKAKTPLFKNWYGGVSFSPTGRWIIGFDSTTKNSFAMDPVSGKIVNVAAKIPYPIYDTEDDHPGGGGPFGNAGYSKDDSVVYVYDQYDIWAVDLTADKPGECVTNGYGRYWNRTVRFDQVDPEMEYIDPAVTRYFSVFDNKTKQDGLARSSFGARRNPEILFMKDALVGNLQRARDAEVFMFQQERVNEYRDVWVTANTDLTGAKQFSDANPQTKDYVWPTVELVEWISLDGQPLQGKLYKPSNFDYAKQYPMITYFYELNSDTLNQYQTPAPSASTINIAWFVSNGYMVFVPDVRYKVGYPGESAVSCIVSGVNKVVDMGNVDPKRLGIQGQSWGGYQVAYLITETNMFAAAGAGAAVGNMFSAYGGIRYGSGLVRQLQYETGQSRIGGTMWEYPMRYYENSPIFFMDKVQTPTLFMNNDKNGSIPYTQGIELFTALWRLHKPAWLLVYNNEDHNLIQRKNRKDLSVRLGQFFDHYLKGEPMPVWMSEGIPATKKGTYGFEKPGESGAGVEKSPAVPAQLIHPTKTGGENQNPIILP